MFQKVYASLKFKQNEQLKPQIYLASSWHINFDLFVKLNMQISNSIFSFILFEEGLSTYYPSSESVTTIWKDSGKNKTLLKQFFSFIFNLLNKYLQLFIESRLSFQNMNIFTQNKNSLLTNKVALNYYSLMLKKTILDNEKINTQIFENSVIICTMAIPRNEMDIDAYILLLEQVIDCLSDKNVRIVIKPHPRELDYKEMYSSLNCMLFDNKAISIESILTNYTIKNIIGFSSTSLITASLFFNTNSISLVSLQQSSIYRKKVRDEMKDFEDIFSDFVSMPNSMLELRKLIQ